MTAAWQQCSWAYSEESQNSQSMSMSDALTMSAAASPHLDHHANGTIELPGHGTFGFPVQGTNPFNAVMSAVDESGKSQLHYRIGDSKLAVKTWQRNLDSVEVIIAPECQMRMESVLLLIAASSSWLRTYFEPTGGGG
jgi:hypothetical protein